MKKISVLVVEDDDKFLKSILSIIESKGFPVSGVHTISEAVHHLKKNNNHTIVVTDINLQGGSGLDLLAQIGMNHPHIPVIVITGYASLQSSMRALRLGAYDYITKPFEPEMLIHSLRRAYEKLSTYNYKQRTESKLKKLVDELEKKNKEIEKLSHFKSFMISMASHDLKTILTVIKGYHKMLAENCGAKFSMEEKNVVDEGRRSLKRALLMIESLLDYHSVEMGTINLQLSEFQIEEVIDECVDFLNPYAEMKKVKISKEIDGNGLTVFGDRLKVAQILDNLITNSIKFASAGGIIHIEAKKTVEDKLRISVKDNGCGIPREKIKKILSSDPLIFKREGTGIVGLGLSICKRLVEVQKGELAIESDHGAGMEVSFTLPSKNR